MTSDIGQFPESRTGNPYKICPGIGSRYCARAPSRSGNLVAQLGLAAFTRRDATLCSHGGREHCWPRRREELAEHQERQEHQAGWELNLTLAQLKRLLSESWRRCCLSVLIWAVPSPSNITATNKLMTSMVGQLDLRIKSSKQIRPPDLVWRVQGGSL
jgi:hypothetical protein